MEFWVLKLVIERWKEAKVVFYQNIELRLDRKKYNARHEFENVQIYFFVDCPTKIEWGTNNLALSTSKSADLYKVFDKVKSDVIASRV
jgi:hypothetical protein